jgi:gamma-glutamylcyclotransferase (GGCT)/AIG2-like uncharacterized protein YtfP
LPGREIMAWPRRLFFYGTLTHQHDNPLTRTFLPRLSGRARRGFVRGNLLLISARGGAYPVLVPGAGRVRGWVYGGLRPIERSTLAALDAWEGCNPRRPGRGEYRRVRCTVHTRCGPLGAQVYVPNRRSQAGLRRVSGGDFAAFATARGLRVFAC